VGANKGKGTIDFAMEAINLKKDDYTNDAMQPTKKRVRIVA
jgi:hypothetical protein